MMKLRNQPRRSHPSSGWRAATLAALVLCAGLVVPSRGSAGGGNGETIGTLPNTNGGSNLDISRGTGDSTPALYLEGSMQSIFNAVDGLSGRSLVTAEVIDAANQIVRVTFHGDLRLDLERAAFERGSLTIGWSVPQAFGPARVTMVLGDRALASGVVTGRNLGLPVQELESIGGLDVAPLEIVTNGRRGMHAVLDVFTSGDHLILSQTH